MRFPRSRSDIEQLVPGGRDGRRMLLVSLTDKAGSGLWYGTSALYYTYVAGLAPHEIGLLLGVAGAVGVAGTPVAGRVADHVPLTRLLPAVHALRAAAAVGILFTGTLWLLLPIAALGSLGDRSASVLTKLYAARVAGPDRVRYQALQRTVVNIGFGIGGLAAAVALAIGTGTAYRTMLVGDALSFAGAALLVLRCAEPPSPIRVVATASTASGGQPPHSKAPATGPWRDRGYLAYTATETLLFLDDTALNVGLPLWIATATVAPHSLVALLFVLNNVLVVLFQVRLSRLGDEPRRAAASLPLLGVAFLVAGGAMAVSAVDSAGIAVAALVVAATAFTAAEIVHAAISWELSLALAPGRSQGAYLGVHGLAQSAQRSAGPVLLTSAVMAAGPLGWLGLGAGLAAVSVGQRTLVRRRLDRLDALERPGAAAPQAPAFPSGTVTVSGADYGE
ncbi:MFS transporter [Actinacidiphila glaucinigra]|uniref:MFS transporter n=1 Tax=Actinacidiphila glaucinigra TaxID=235986 RepID=UPI0033ACC574